MNPLWGLFYIRQGGERALCSMSPRVTAHESREELLRLGREHWITDTWKTYHIHELACLIEGFPKIDYGAK